MRVVMLGFFKAYLIEILGAIVLRYLHMPQNIDENKTAPLALKVQCGGDRLRFPGPGTRQGGQAKQMPCLYENSDFHYAGSSGNCELTSQVNIFPRDSSSALISQYYKQR